MNDNNYSVGAMMQDGKNKALRTLAITAGIIVYVGMLAYSAVHNYSLLTRGISQDMIIWAALGVVALELSAAALPIALHWWTHAPMQRIAAFGFYALDIVLILGNVVLDFAITAGETMPAWLEIYRFFAVPVTPVLAGLGWSMLFMLDPSQRERAMAETLRASTREVLANRIAQAAKAADISLSVDRAANSLARQIVSDTLGVTSENTQRNRPALPVADDRPQLPKPKPLPLSLTGNRVRIYKPVDMARAADKSRYNAQADAQSPELAGHPNGHKPGTLTGQE